MKGLSNDSPFLIKLTNQITTLIMKKTILSIFLLMHLIDVYQGNSVNFKSLAKNIKNHKIKIARIFFLRNWFVLLKF